MNFVELRELADELCEIWGYSNTLRAPDWYKLVNAGYKDICIETDIIRGPEIMFQTVAHQREYVIGGPDSVSYFLTTPGAENQSSTIWPDLKGTLNTQDIKSFLDVMTTTGGRIYPQDEALIRRTDPMWLWAGNGQPSKIWSPRPNVVALHTVPDAVYTIMLYCVMGPPLLSTDNDIPKFWDAYHHAIAIRAAYLHARKYAKGEAREILAARDSEYQEIVSKIKQLQMEDSGMDATRYVEAPEPERIFL